MTSEPVGHYRYTFESPSGRKIELRGVYDTVDEPRGFRYTESYDFSPLKVLVTTTLDGLGDRTGFKQILVYGSKEERDADFAGVATSAQTVYASFDLYLQSAP